MYSYLRALVTSVFLLVFCVALAPGTAAAEKSDLLFAFFTRGWMPLEMMDGGTPSGASLDLFRAVMPSDLKLGVEATNKPRKLLYGQSAPVYTRLTAKEWLNRDYSYWFSDPVMPLNTVLYSPVRKPLEYYGPRSLEGKTMGCIRNYSYPKIEMVVAAGKTKRYDVNTIPVLLRMVKEGRVDAAILDEGEALWTIRSNPELSLEDFYISSNPVDEVQLRFVFNRVPDWEKRLPEINDRIRTLRESGKLDRILSKYR